MAGGGFVASRVITLATYIVLARLVTPDELGDFTAGSILVGIGLLLAGSGMAAALIHRSDRLEEAAATAVVATLFNGALVALLGWASAPLLGAFFDSDTVTAVAVAMAGVLFLQSARSIPNAMLQRRFSFLRRLVVEPIAAVAFGVVAIAATASGLGVWGLVIGQYALAITDLVLSWGLAGWRPQLRLVSFSMWRELVGYGRHILAGTAVRRIGDRAPILAAGGFIGTASVGQLQYANRIVTTPFSLLVAGISYVIFPAFARISDDRRRFRKAFLRSLRWTMVVAMPLGLILAPLGEPLAILLFGERWAEAGQITIALCVFIPARTLAAVIGEGFKGTGQPVHRTWVNVTGVLLGALTMVILTPLIGLYGVAAGISTDALVSSFAAMLRARGALDIEFRTLVGAIAPAGASAILMAVVVFAVETLLVQAASHPPITGLLLLCLEGILGIVVYAVGLRITAPGTFRELPRLVREGVRSRPRGVGPNPDAR